MKAWKNGAFAALLLGLQWGVSVSAALADAKDYEFQLVQSEMKKGDGRHRGRAPDQQEDRQARDRRGDRRRRGSTWLRTQWARWPRHSSRVPSNEPGVYSFKTDLSMAGRWLLSIAAKVQGEAETVVGKITFRATR